MFMTINQPWLKDRQNPLIDLIDEWEKDDQQQLIFELLDRFTFLEPPDFQQGSSRLCGLPLLQSFPNPQSNV